MFGDDLSAAIMASLGDGKADCLDAEGSTVARGIDVIIEHNLQRVGPEGLFVSTAVGITWNTADLPGTERGGTFVVGSRRYLVEEIVSDDGQMATAACMEAP
ncbi:hypothetical protein SAMN04244572_02383 [Azotobacter beijerinckii]|uniref:Uncharacterized protein n=1 Tax=Azotobacter beijerinckii TaxID=170623 RepID=A0A1H6VCY0_9GAMM|nr:hypothetical protein [Azotobacter beijerinckii]SEI99677.1 hypothetical protein SAMN04244572_02383 [Azotobacter beijerinckii]SER89791.1 hypothetical protein SAMN04244573_04544 [Azotobacter beijerinckii]